MRDSSPKLLCDDEKPAKRGLNRPFSFSLCTLPALLVGVVFACQSAPNGERNDGHEDKVERPSEAEAGPKAEPKAEPEEEVPIVGAGVDQVEAPLEEQAGPDTASDAAPTTDDAHPPIAGSIPASILPPRCKAEHEEIGAWDGAENFTLSCPRPGLKGWTKVGVSESYGAGSAFRQHIYRHDGWMLLWSEVCCSSCDPDKLVGCEPHMAARLYPPSDLKDCAHSQICAHEGLCLQRPGWCSEADEE